jgi:hypothetical protein
MNRRPIVLRKPPTDGVIDLEDSALSEDERQRLYRAVYGDALADLAMRAARGENISDVVEELWALDIVSGRLV